MAAATGKAYPSATLAFSVGAFVLADVFVAAVQVGPEEPTRATVNLDAAKARWVGPGD